MAATVSPVTVEGLKEFRAALRALGPEWGRMLSKTHRDIAKRITANAQAKAQAYGPQQARMAKAIKGSGTQTGAFIKVAQSSRNPYANVAFWGQMKRTGWYGRMWAAGVRGKAQSLPWVGSDWDVGSASEGPYAINAAIHDAIPEIMREYSAALDGLFHKAFPD